jgi:hypothetical protein
VPFWFTSEQNEPLLPVGLPQYVLASLAQVASHSVLQQYGSMAHTVCWHVPFEQPAPVPTWQQQLAASSCAMANAAGKQTATDARTTWMRGSMALTVCPESTRTQSPEAGISKMQGTCVR